jgi:hypothetical protein
MSTLTQSQTVFRSTHVRNYTVFSNDLIANPDLSWKAKSILMYLLSKPADWQTRLEDIVKHGKDGRDAVLSGIKELKKAGYLKKVRITDPATKRVVRWETHVFEHPQSEPDVENPDSGFPDSGKADATKYGSTNPGKQNKKNMEEAGRTSLPRPFEKSGEANQGGEVEQQHSLGKQKDQKHNTPDSGSEAYSSAAAPRQKWRLGRPLPTDSQGYAVLPREKPEVAHDWGCVAVAKAKAVLWTQRDIVELCDYDEMSLSQDEDGEYWVDTFADGEVHESDSFAPRGDLPLRKLRSIAINGIRGSFLSQAEFNSILQENFEMAMRQELANHGVAA